MCATSTHIILCCPARFWDLQHEDNKQIKACIMATLTLFRHWLALDVHIFFLEGHAKRAKHTLAWLCT
jgi:hypothetical protein